MLQPASPGTASHLTNLTYCLHSITAGAHVSAPIRGEDVTTRQASHRRLSRAVIVPGQAPHRAQGGGRSAGKASRSGSGKGRGPRQGRREDCSTDDGRGWPSERSGISPSGQVLEAAGDAQGDSAGRLRPTADNGQMTAEAPTHVKLRD